MLYNSLSALNIGTQRTWHVLVSHSQLGRVVEAAGIRVSTHIAGTVGQKLIRWKAVKMAQVSLVQNHSLLT